MENKKVKDNLIERLKGIGCPLLYFDGVCVKDMTKYELELLCSWLGHQLLSKNSFIEVIAEYEN